MTMMVTHNMKDAIRFGNRLIMMNEGRIILDIKGEDKKNLTVRDLMDEFVKASGEELTNDRALLS
ncbi:MAG: ABC transporter ATP-binding protein, partial [Spirochaetales bacterium]|nr:ABC transporter ATP-binding protein [Spirochaetales bacterium]